MDWRAKVELFEQIRREYEFGIGTIVGVAAKLGVHRRMVREAIGSALPKPRKKPERPRWKLKEAVEFIDAILEADRKAPRKQRHTAHRIWTRIGSELPQCKIAERTVREYVHERKIALGLMVSQTCVPQSYAWGVEAQVDWYEAYADLSGERTKLQVFAMRSMASGAAFHCAYLHATQQAFLEAHELAFAYFGGVFRKLRYDNLTSAVKKILRGHRREETACFVAFRSHWRFEAEFCTPAEPHEKGGIEGEAGYFRRNHWVPVPQAKDLMGKAPKTPHQTINNLGWAKLNRRTGPGTLAKRNGSAQRHGEPETGAAGALREGAGLVPGTLLRPKHAAFPREAAGGTRDRVKLHVGAESAAYRRQQALLVSEQPAV
ncbi:MAG: IS21 family transposase [Acidobacteriota bacterium]|nr:IS21 family transposase [Acidobacteriota bacterium]